MLARMSLDLAGTIASLALSGKDLLAVANKLSHRLRGRLCVPEARACASLVVSGSCVYVCVPVALTLGGCL